MDREREEKEIEVRGKEDRKGEKFNRETGRVEGKDTH